MSHQLSPDHVLALREVGFRHDSGHEVLGGVDLTLNPGDRMCILGPNGSGKSTLLKLCVGLLQPTSGQLFLDGQPVSYHRAGKTAWRSAVQLVMQEPDDAIFATTVRADVAYGPINLGLSADAVEQRTDAALAALGITELAERIPQQLSYGQRKRVVIAGAVAMQPRVLLLDEPTAGLDPQSVRDLTAILATLNAAGTALVVTTHDVDFAYAFADHTAFLLNRTVVLGHRDELYSDQSLIAQARLETPWALLASRALGTPVLRREDMPPL